MYFRQYIPWPAMPVDPCGWQYFWHQLPLGLPGLLTFIAGIFLFWAAFREGFRTPHRRSLYFPLGLLAFALACRGLMAGAAATVSDLELYRRLSTFLFIASMLSAPFLMDLLDHMSRRKYPFVRGVFYFLLLVTGGVMVVLAYTGVYPDPEKIRKTEFGFIAPLHWLADVWLGCIILIVMPTAWFLVRRRFGPSMLRKGRPVLHVTAVLLIILSVGDMSIRRAWIDLPSAYGFAFVPLLLVGYDFFRFVLRDLNRLLFHELGLFYLINLVLAAVLITFALASILGLAPESFHKPYWPSVIPSALGVAATFGIGILIAGMNPRAPVNQYAATSAYCIAFATLIDLVINSGLETIIAARLAQLCWLPIPGLMSAFPRFVLAVLNRPLPQFMPLLDFSGAVTALFALSPWSVPGYFVDDYGRYPAIGPVVLVFSIMAGAVCVYLLVRVIRSYRHMPRGDVVAIVGVSSIFVSLWFGWPATLGFPVPRIGSYFVFPVAVLAFFSIRRGALQSDKVTYRVNRRLTSTVFFIAPLVLAMMISLVLRESRVDLSLLHLAFMGLPILLFAYQLTNFLSQPVSEELARSFDEQTRARRETELARRREAAARRQAESIQRELEEEIRMASRIQESLLPRELPTPPEARIAYRYAPMLAVGGDFLDLLYVPARKLLGFFICDVSGHGVPAAFVASMVKMALRDWGNTLQEPAALLTSIHERLRGKMAGHTLTACAGCIELSTGELRVASAGHPPPILLSARGPVGALDVRGRLLMDHPLWKAGHAQKKFRLKAGDKLVLFTDGLIEARSAQDELLGDEKFIELLARYRRASPGDLCSGIHSDVRAFAGDQEMSDDFTILAVEFTRNEAEAHPEGGAG